jgi:hypothetical protein
MRIERVDPVIVKPERTLGRMLKEINKLANKPILRWAGDWDTLIHYEPGDLVTDGTTKWLALTKNDGVTPIEGTDWTEIAGSSTGGGGGGGDVHPIDVAPALPSVYDDEFDGVSLDPKWISPAVTANPITPTVNKGRLIIQPTNYALNARLYGIYQALAGGVTSFKIWTKATSPLAGTDHYAGLIIGVSGGAGKGHVFGVGPNGANAFGANMGATYNEGGSDWSAFDGYNNTFNPTNFGPRDIGWYRIRWDAAASTIYFDYATDGDQWINWTSRGGMTQPDRIGLGMYATSNPTWTTGIKLNSRYFRFEANANF